MPVLRTVDVVAPSYALEPPVHDGDALMFVDHRGVAWTVREVTCAAAPSSRGPISLVFSSESACRRVYEYPGSWKSLSTDGLVALSNGR